MKNLLKRKIQVVLLASIISICMSGCSVPPREESPENNVEYNDQSQSQPNELGSKEDGAPENPAQTDMPQALASEEPGTESSDESQTGLSPYEVGQVMIIMYHAIVEGEPPSQWQRNVDDFKNDLQTLYDDGYRLCSLKDLMNNNVTVPKGYTPVVLTFDDGLKQSFSLEEQGGALVPKQNTGVYILEEFCKKYPDFGRGATFFINGETEPFPGAGTVSERLGWLVDNGYDVGNHTKDHIRLGNRLVTAEKIQQQIGYVDKLIRDSVPGYTPVGFSYPYGERPEGELLRYIVKGTYEGEEYKYTFALKEGYNGLPSAPNRKDYSTLNIPRVCGSSIDEENAFDLGYFLKYYKENPEYKYVSDGNPETITVPEQYKDNIDMDSIKNKELILY